MIATDSTVEMVAFYVNGQWQSPRERAFGSVTNPATGTTIAAVPYAEEADIDRAVRGAHEAFLK